MADIEFLDPLKLHFSPVQGVKGLPGMLKQDFPFCCELHAPGTAGEKGQAQAVLQLADGLADGRLLI